MSNLQKRKFFNSRFENLDFGIFYLYWGDNHKQEVEVSKSSALSYRYNVSEACLNEDSILGNKSQMYDLSPFENTLYLDTDTLICGNLDFGFEMAERHGIALSIAPFYTARRWDANFGDIVEYNTGVTFFKKSQEVKKVFETWEKHAFDYTNDQASFALAIYETGFNPFILPLNWNYRYDYHSGRFLNGDIKIWHSRKPIPEQVRKPHQNDKFWEINC